MFFGLLLYCSPHSNSSNVFCNLGESFSDNFWVTTTPLILASVEGLEEGGGEGLLGPMYCVTKTSSFFFGGGVGGISKRTFEMVK